MEFYFSTIPCDLAGSCKEPVRQSCQKYARTYCAAAVEFNARLPSAAVRHNSECCIRELWRNVWIGSSHKKLQCNNDLTLNLG